MAEVIAVLALFGVPGIYFFGKTDIGQAIVHRLRHGEGAPDPSLLAEVDELRARLAEVEDRLDFAERQLTSGDVPRPMPHAPRT